jgi:hypothetical protein
MAVNEKSGNLCQPNRLTRDLPDIINPPFCTGRPTIRRTTCAMPKSKSV